MANNVVIPTEDWDLDAVPTTVARTELGRFRTLDKPGRELGTTGSHLTPSGCAHVVTRHIQRQSYCDKSKFIGKPQSYIIATLENPHVEHRQPGVFIPDDTFIAVRGVCHGSMC